MTAPAPLTSKADAALAYARRGWPVLPLHWWEHGVCSCGDPACRTPAKHPYSTLVPRGVHDATAIADVVATWWRREPRANIGVRTGPESGLVVVDVDVRDHVDGRATLQGLESTLGPLPATVEAITGSGSRHLLFQHPGHDVVGKLGDGVDVKAKGGYIVVAPSSHASGRLYAWDVDGHPDDLDPAPLPDAWRARLRFAAPPVTVSTPTAPVPLDPYTVDKVRSALHLLPDDYDTWIRAGMALHHEGGGSAQAFGLWAEWSQSFASVDPARTSTTDELRAKWRSFGRGGGAPVTLATVYRLATDRGWVPPTPPITFHAAPTPPTDAFDPALAYGAPGALGAIVRWSLSTAVQPVPLFSLAGALAVGALVAGRHYTLGGTASHLFVLVAGRTGAGKDHVKQTVAALVPPAFLGPGDYASDSAILSTLRDRPQLVSVLDEFGQQLASTKGHGSHHRASALRMLMEAWSARLLLGKALSTLATGEATLPVQIQRPSLTVVALTTPTRLHEALESAHVGDGFLNRWLLLEHDADRVVPEPPGELAPPPDLVAWVASVLGTPINASGVAPSPHDVPRTDEATAALRAVAVDATAAANALDRVAPGAGGLWSRAAEQVRRLTLIAALADAAGPLEAVADAQHVAWARALVWWSQAQLVKTAMDRIGDTPFERATARVLAAIEAGGAAGVLKRELLRLSPRLPVRDLDAVLEALESAERITVLPGPRGSARCLLGTVSPPTG